MDEQEPVTSHSSASQTRRKSDNENCFSTRSYSPQNSWREHNTLLTTTIVVPAFVACVIITLIIKSVSVSWGISLQVN